MDLTRPVIGWKNLLDPMTWQGITGILPLLFPTIEGVPKTKLLNRVTKLRSRLGLFHFVSQGAAADFYYLLSDGGVTIGTDITSSPADDEANRVFIAPYVVPEGKLWVMPSLCAFHDDVTPRFLKIVSAGINGTYTSTLAMNPLAVDGNVHIYTDRPVILRSGWTVGVQANALAAGKFVNLWGQCIEVNEEEPCPFF